MKLRFPRSRVRLFTLLLPLLLWGCTSARDHSGLEQQLRHFISTKNADIGVAVIIDGTDTVAVNGSRPYEMQSVYKFPIVLALADYGLTGARLLPDTVTVTRRMLLPDTYSPMRDRYAGADTVRLPLLDIIAYSLRESDNNASDILLGLLPAKDYAGRYLAREGFADIKVVTSEAEMHADTSTCALNTSTPLAMAALFDRFRADHNDPFSRKIKGLIETCATGQRRLPRPLAGLNATIGHKTGTGCRIEGGGITAVNDAGYVVLPDGRHYSIAVFINNSPYPIAETESIIGDISSMVLDHVRALPPAGN